MTRLGECLAALRFGLASAMARPRHALLAAAGLLVAAVTLLIILTIPVGIERVAMRTGSSGVAVVLANRSGWDETEGNIAPELVARIGVLPQVARNAEGVPLVAPQFAVTHRLKRRDGSERTVLVRGVTPNVWDVAGDGARIVKGSRIAPALQQVVSGLQAADQYLYADTGAELRLGRGVSSQWEVVGEFSAGGGLWESELWADIDALRAMFNVPGQSTSVWVRLASPAAFDEFVDAMQADPRLRGLQVFRQQGFYAGRVAFLKRFVEVAAFVVALVLGLMAVLACSNAVGLALRARRRELAVLRAIGFGSNRLFVALIVEMLVLAGACAAVAMAIGVWLVHAQSVDSSTQTASIRFTLAVTPTVMGLTLGYTLLLGLAGTLIPAWRIVRSPLTLALARE